MAWRPTLHSSRFVSACARPNGRLRLIAILHRVLLYFHGGGYCSGSIRSHRGMVSEIGRAAKVRTLALGYRLAPENPFPAALEDAVAAVEYLLAMGIPAERIAIGGDSAGGGLTLATMIRSARCGPAIAGLRLAGVALG